VPFLIHVSDIHISDIHVVSDIRVSDIHVSVGPPISASVSDKAHVCVTEEEEEKEERTNQTKENKDKVHDSETLSQYDVSVLSSSQPFERVNLPESLSQYVQNEEKEETEVPVFKKPIKINTVSANICSTEVQVSEEEKEEEEEEESLSQYDVSSFTASQLFERVNLPDNLSQYDNACLDPVLDTSELADTNHFEGS